MQRVASLQYGAEAEGEGRTGDATGVLGRHDTLELVHGLGIGVRVARVFRSSWQTSGAATDYVPPARLGTADSTPTCGRGPVQPTTPWDYQEEMADRRRNGTGVAGMRR